MRLINFFLFLSFLLWADLPAQIVTDSVHMKKNAPENAATNCATVVKEAEIQYNSGNYDECLNMLQKGLTECHFSKAEKEEALILIARVNLEKDRIGDVDKALIKLLKNNANYEPKEGAYQQDFYSHFNNVVTRPLLSIGGHVGFNIPKYSVAKTYSVLNGVDYSAPYQFATGFTGGLHFEYTFYKNTSFNLGCDYSLYRYSRSLSGAPSDYHTEYHESLTYLSIPLYLKKYFGSGSSKPYLLFGANYNILQKAEADITTQYTAVDFLTNESDKFDISSNAIDQRALRNKAFWGLTGGAGFSYKIKNLVFHVDARYTLGLDYFTNSNNRLNNEDLIFKYYYVDNAVRLNRFELLASVSYIFLYDVKMKKK